MSSLAIIIPAYKNTYFLEVLNSLASQTNKNFTVYIGDDHSPNDLETIVQNFEIKLNIFYTRFDYNIGAKNLVSQWNRCVALTKGEEWLWLFSDDDLIDVTCVERFYQALAENQDAFDLYRFNTCIINAAGKITNVMPVGPTVETSEQMAYHLLLGERGNSMPDHIFSRRVYEKNGGFVATAYAQGADWAMSILFSQEKGIYVIPEAKVYWRLSGTNISSVSPKKKAEMLSGHIQFVEWIIEHFHYLRHQSSAVTYDMMMGALIRNLSTVIVSHYKGFDNKNIIKCYKIMRQRLGWSRYDAINAILDMASHTEFFLNKIHRINRFFRNLSSETY